ncbi:hypothetical protein FSP39_007870 [Pinctada imbricata]|uniref:Uncharacterized protein n=1 Tax=Pinctada imbricata TaxID=66713 RepID=A0AA88XF06_PINIB|nr:hypothetical protein FSP39_007870 [Pinctada imbricata]
MAASAKIASFFILFVMTFSFGLLPYVMLKFLNRTRFSKQRIEYVISMLNCLSGGVFFGTAILHLLPEAMEQVTEHIESDYPVTSALVGAGFLLVLSVEHIVGSYHGGLSFHGHSHNHQEHGQPFQRLDEEDIQKDTVKNQLSNSLSNSKEATATRISYSKTNPSEEAESSSPSSNRQLKSKQVLSQNNAEPDVNITVGETTDSTSAYDEEKLSKLRTIILVLALSLHMLFEGLAVGLQETNQDVWELVGILTLHKCLVAFSAGLQLEEALHSFMKLLISMIGFSLVAPIGVGIGFMVTEYGGDGQAQGIASGVLQSLATGTFFYVTFFEILQKELANTYNLLKVFFTVIGFLVVIGVQFMPDKD